MMTVKHIGDEDFDKTVKENGLVVVDFYADWCGPCQMVGPVMEDLSKEMEKVTFAKVDVDKHRDSAGKYGISSIPCLLIFKEGKLVDRIVGALPKQIIKERLEKFV